MPQENVPPEMRPVAAPAESVPTPDEEAEKQLLNEVWDFSVNWIDHHQGTAREFITALVSRFGFGIRMHILDIAERMQQDRQLNSIQRDYVRTNLSVEQLTEALQGKGSGRFGYDATLDELFARSVQHRKSQKFIEAINFVAKFRDYAPYNNMLVYLQRPSATFWATQSDWYKRFGRRIKEDTVPIIMLQPRGPIMLVYDMVDTDGPPLPERFTSFATTTGSFDVSILERTLNNCVNVQIRVKFKRLGMLNAGSAMRMAIDDRAKPTIELREDLSPQARYATLCHELGHIYLGHLGTDQDAEWPSRLNLKRNQRELEAEAVAYLVCRRAGLITTSAEYLAGYLANPDDLEGISVDMIMKVAGHIERMGQVSTPS